MFSFVKLDLLYKCSIILLIDFKIFSGKKIKIPKRVIKIPKQCINKHSIYTVFIDDIVDIGIIKKRFDD